MLFNFSEFPKRLIACVFVTLMVLCYVGPQLISPSPSSKIPKMSKPSIFYHLSKGSEPLREHDQKMVRQLWQGSEEVDAMFNSDPYRSAWASGHYEAPTVGVHADGSKLSDRELLLFRQDAKSRGPHSLENAPDNIWRSHQTNQANLGLIK